MTDASKPWPTPEEIMAAFPTRPDHGKRVVMDIRRDGQPCSTDEFLLMAVRKHAYGDYELNERLQEWLSGNFTDAMEGLE